LRVFGVIVACRQGGDPIEQHSRQYEYVCMLKRAGISLVVTLVAAVWGFTGTLPFTAPFGRILFFIAAGFFLLSLLFSLFEPGAGPRSRDPVTVFQPNPRADRPNPQMAVLARAGPVY
jgi:uncharacterized membrane protein YtjA (UPF0391 family)